MACRTVVLTASTEKRPVDIPGAICKLRKRNPSSCSQGCFHTHIPHLGIPQTSPLSSHHYVVQRRVTHPFVHPSYPRSKEDYHLGQVNNKHQRIIQCFTLGLAQQPAHHPPSAHLLFPLQTVSERLQVVISPPRGLIFPRPSNCPPKLHTTHLLP